MSFNIIIPTLTTMAPAKLTVIKLFSFIWKQRVVARSLWMITLQPGSGGGIQAAAAPGLVLVLVSN